MVEFASLPAAAAPKHLIAYAAVAVLGLAVSGYAVHEHNTAENLAAQNAQANAALAANQHQLSDLTAKVNMLAARAETQAAPAVPSAPPARIAANHRPSAAHRLREDPRYKKLQSQLDAQGKVIEQTRKDLEGDLASTRTELTGSIAHTHDELVLLRKRGERNYAEFDISKSKQFKREGALELRLKKANTKHQYADLEMMVDDRNLSQKHVNLYQPVMFYTPDSPQPVEVVINDISKDHIHGYVSSPKYRQSELASMANPTDAQGQGATDASQPPSPRKKLPVPEQ